MKQRFYVMIECEKELEPKEILFALREARPNWGDMSASLAVQQKMHPTPESLATSQTVVNADNLSQSDSESNPAQARVI